MSNTNLIEYRYVSCIRVEGKPILPPLMNDDKRRVMQKMRDEAIAVESRLKEKRRAQLMDQVQIILDKCTTLDELNVSKVTPSKYRLISEPLLQTPVRINSSLSEPTKKPIPAVTSYSLPSTPLLDEVSIEKLHKKFLSMKKDYKDISISESSALSTDLGPYMQNSGSESSLADSESSTPRALTMSDTDISTSLDCSTPIKSQRLRRLSYTLEAPSPVLLKMMQNKATEEEKLVILNIPKLNLYDFDESVKNDANKIEAENNQNKNLTHETSVHCSAAISNKTSNINEESSNRNLVNLNLRPKGTEDVVNGNSNEKQMINTSENRNKTQVERRISITCDNNRNSPRTQDVLKNENFVEEFLKQQQKLMNELMEKQAQEQERLVQLFKEQEKQLVMQMQAQTIQQQPAVPKSKSPVCRSLNRVFDRSAKARSLFESGRLSALVRGYLTRRLMTTDRVQSIIQTIRDTTACLKELNQGSMAILPSDLELHRRLLQQLNGAIHTFHDIFFEWDVNERLLVIARDREKKADQMIVTGMPIRMRPRSRSLSSATVKSIERKLTRQESQNSSRPSSASTAHPRTSPSSVASTLADRKRSPSSSGSFSSFSAAPSNGSLHGKNKHKPSTRKPWRC